MIHTRKTLKLSIFLLLGIASVVVITDFYTKRLVLQTMFLGESIPVIPQYLSLTYIRNSGAAFGFLAGVQSPWKPVFLWGVSGIAIVFLIYYYVVENALRTRCALALILGGALGNMIDRIRWGEVVDFIDVYWNEYHWPAFNVADSCICVGMGLLIYCMIKDERSEKMKK